MEAERCGRCGHPETDHHEELGCLNRHCRCKNEDWYYKAMNDVSTHIREREAERQRMNLPRLTT